METVTTLDEIFKKASYKLENTDYINFDEAELKEEFQSLLEEAIGRFDKCFDDKNVDFFMETIEPALTFKEFKIVTDLMSLYYIQRLISNITRFGDGVQLTTSDYKTFSEANMLQQKQNIFNTLNSMIETQMLEYGSKKAISFLNKRVGVEK